MSTSDLKPDRNLALELVRVTEAAAMAAGRWVGRGDKNDADGVAVNAMRAMISSVGMRGTVVIGEGEKDNAPMLYNGEAVGTVLVAAAAGSAAIAAASVTRTSSSARLRSGDWGATERSSGSVMD